MISARIADLADRLWDEVERSYDLENPTPYHHVLIRVVGALDWATPRLRRRGL